MAQRSKLRSRLFTFLIGGLIACLGWVLPIFLLYHLRDWQAIGDFREPYQQLSRIYRDVEDKAGSSPSEADWKEFGQKMEGQIKPIKKKLAELKNSQHPVRAKLNALAGQINSLLKKPPDDLEASLRRTKKTQDEAAKMLGL